MQQQAQLSAVRTRRRGLGLTRDLYYKMKQVSVTCALFESEMYLRLETNRVECIIKCAHKGQEKRSSFWIPQLHLREKHHPAKEEKT